VKGGSHQAFACKTCGGSGHARMRLSRGISGCAYRVSAAARRASAARWRQSARRGVIGSQRNMAAARARSIKKRGGVSRRGVAAGDIAPREISIKRSIAGKIKQHLASAARQSSLENIASGRRVKSWWKRAGERQRAAAAGGRRTVSAKLPWPRTLRDSEDRNIAVRAAQYRKASAA